MWILLWRFQIHGSVNGKNFNMKMRAEHIELLHSPWLIELGAFYLNFPVSEIGESGEFFKQFSCDLSSSQPTITLVLSDDVKLEYGLTCAVCLVRSSFFLSFFQHYIYIYINCQGIKQSGYCFPSLCFGLWSSFLQGLCCSICISAGVWPHEDGISSI